MLTADALVRLHRTHRDVPVLSVYIDADEHDPAARRAWRTRLDQAIERARGGIADARERDTFDRAYARLKGTLAGFDGFLPGRGWVGFATADAVLHADLIAAPVPNLVRWKHGPSVATFVRVIALTTPAVTVLVDRRRARLFRRENGAFAEVQSIEAEGDFGDLSDNVNMSKRGGTTTGVRGEADRDVGNRLERVAAERVLKQLTDAVRTHAGNDAVVVVGGPAERTAIAVQHLSKTMPDRVVADDTIDFHTPAAALDRATEVAAWGATARAQDRLAGEIADLAAAGGRACVGRKSTEHALTERRVELLVLSRSLVDADPDYADERVTAAFDQGATVEDLAGDAAARLDRDGEGIAARLRFAR